MTAQHFNRAAFLRGFLLLLLPSACGGRAELDAQPGLLPGQAGGSEGSGTAAGGGGGLASTGGQASIENNAGGAVVFSGGASAGGAPSSIGGFPISAGGAPSAGGALPMSAGGNQAGGSPSTGGASVAGSCPFGNFDADADPEALDCQPWTVCQPGTFQTEVATATRDRVCTPCPVGTFADEIGASTCEPLTTCTIGQVVAVPGSSRENTQCDPAESFPLVTDTNYPAGGKVDLVATDGGLQVLAHRGYYFYYYPSKVLRFSYAGALLTPWTLEEYPSFFTAIAGQGDNLYESMFNWTYNLVSESWEGSESLTKLDSAGAALWVQELESVGEFNEGVLLAVLGERVVRVSRYYFEDCVDEQPSGCAQYETTIDLILSSYSLAGDLLWEHRIETEGTLSRAEDLSLTSDGRIFVACSGYSTPSVLSVLEFDEDGQRLTEHTPESLDCPHCSILAADSAGTVYAVGRGVEPNTGNEFESTVLKTIHADGTLSPTYYLDLEINDQIVDATVGTDGIYLVGRNTKFDDALFVVTSPAGEVLSRVTAGGSDGDSAGAVTQAPNGQIYAAGETWTSKGPGVFVLPWPE